MTNRIKALLEDAHRDLASVHMNLRTANARLKIVEVHVAGGLPSLQAHLGYIHPVGRAIAPCEVRDTIRNLGVILAEAVIEPVTAEQAQAACMIVARFAAQQRVKE